MGLSKQRLREALARGAALAASVAVACGGSAEGAGAGSGNTTGGDAATDGTIPTKPPAEAATDVESSPDAAADQVAEDGTTVPPELPPYPPAAYPTCTGENHDGGYYGRCCTGVICYTPAAGECAPASDAGSVLPSFPPGSGSCTCGEVLGPFGPRPDHAPSFPGDCCYLVPEIACEGRPLYVAGAARVARPARRADWSRALA